MSALETLRSTPRHWHKQNWSSGRRSGLWLYHCKSSTCSILSWCITGKHVEKREGLGTISCGNAFTHEAGEESRKTGGERSIVKTLVGPCLMTLSRPQ